MIEEISAFFLAYNEEGSIKRVITSAIETLSKIAKKYEILIVLYEGSADKTREIAKEISKKNKEVRLAIQKTSEKGYGNAIKIGIKESKYDLIFFSDADMQFDIKEINNLLKFADSYDIIAGYRIDRKDPFIRKFIAKAYNLILRIRFGLKIKDVDCAFKIFHKDIFDKIKISLGTGMVNAEILIKAMKYGYKIKQEGVHHYQRHAGKSVFEGKSSFIRFRVIKDLWHEMDILKKELK